MLLNLFERTMNIFWLTKNEIFPKSFQPFLKEHDITIGHVCTNPKNAVAEYNLSRFDLIVMDFSWYSDTVSGVALLKDFLKVNNEANVVLVTSYYQDVVNEKYRSFGAKGYFNKNDTPENIIECLKKAGGTKRRFMDFNQFALAI